MRDQAESAVAAAQDRFTLEYDLPPSAAVVYAEFAALLDEVEAFGRQGLLLTVPPADEVRALQRWLLGETVRQLRGDTGHVPAPWASAESYTDSERTQGGDVPITPASDDTAVVVRASETRLAPDLAAAGEARRFLRSTLAAWGVDSDLADEAELPLSELVTNAVMHTQAEVLLVVRLDDDAVRIEVHDSSDALPSRRSHDVESGTGRGLELVEALSHRWGVQPTASGKAVWFELSSR